MMRTLQRERPCPYEFDIPAHRSRQDEPAMSNDLKGTPWISHSLRQDKRRIVKSTDANVFARISLDEKVLTSLSPTRSRLRSRSR